MNRVITFIFICFFIGSLYATNDLSVQRPGSGTTKPAYIDNATLVIEPHGGYAEQSLYLKYSDHGGFSGYDNVQITHRFELPPGSVINDMWLWIGDSIVQAVIIDTWKARAIYDSIVNLKRDPAFLFKNNNQYELRVFPLTGGSFRKVKINIISPVRFLANEAIVDLPLKLLRADNNLKKPLTLSFREKENIWGTPTLVNSGQYAFTSFADTNGFHYKRVQITDITSYPNMELRYKLSLPNGKYFSSGENFLGRNYFQYSLNLKDIFKPAIDSSSKKVMIALDLSGKYNKNFTEIIPNLKLTLTEALSTKDSFQIKVAGAGSIKKLTAGWLAATPQNIDNVISAFAASSYGDSIQLTQKARLFYADNEAYNAWGFSGIDSFALRTTFTTLYNASLKFKDADICASYRHCWKDVPVGLQLTSILDSLNTFFQNGGRFVSYFNMDCNDYEKVVTHFIPSLKTIQRVTGNLTLYKNPTGNIGNNFPEYFDHSGNNVLSFNDTSVKIEVKDAQGRPIIISKKIGNGLLVASGIWLFSDDEATRKLLSLPILGLNTGTSRLLWEDLLTDIRNQQATDPFAKVIFVSNSEEVRNQSATSQWITGYLAGYVKKPVFNTINLLYNSTITYPGITINGTTYPGSGFLQKSLSDATYGLHFERQSASWIQIQTYINPFVIPSTTYLSVKAKGNNDSTLINDFVEIKSSLWNSNMPLNFVGSTIANDSVSLQVSAKFFGNDTMRTVSFSDHIVQPPIANGGPVINRSVLANEKIKTLFSQTPIDTNQIVSLAVKNRILCDYSAFLALEPNDSIHFIHPFDEWGLLPSDELPELTDSIYFNAFPNPFNAQITFKVNVASKSGVTLKIYNILGELVKVLAEDEELIGSRTFQWNASGMQYGMVSSGIYIARIEVKEEQTSKLSVRTRKIVLLK